jgi:hypothetical protein
MTKKDQQLIWEAFETRQAPQEGQHGGPGPDISGEDFDQSFDDEEQADDTAEDLLIAITQSPEFDAFPEDIKARAYSLLR